MSAIASRADSGRSSAIAWKLLALTTVAAMVEGYDTQVIGYVAPVISREWGLPPGAFGPTFSVGLLGLMLGCMFIAPLADRFGRKWIIIGSTAAYGALVLATAGAESLTALFWLRFVTGLGLGGALPNLAASAAESAPVHRRTFAVAILFCGFGLGSFVGSVVAAWLMAAYGWQSVFVFGGLASLVLVPVLIGALPGGKPGAAERGAATAEQAIPVAGLFRAGRARVTIALWVIYFMGLMDLYLLASWLPTTIHAQGLSPETAALITGLMQIGGIIGALILGPLVDRLGPNPLLPAAYAFAALCIGLIGFAGAEPLLIAVAVFGAGFGIVGCQNCNSGVVARIYPTEMRATAMGWALGIGRAGSIIGPFLAGRLLATQVDIRTIFLFSAVPALCAALAYLAIGKRPEFSGVRN
jgi:AAHS family 4-hydroxybenzoate transporter-like MFS transporter